MFGMILELIRDKIGRRKYEFSRHAVDQSILRNIRVQEIEEAIAGHSEIIEEYPEDKYGPSYLLMGVTASARLLHIQCACVEEPIIKIVTLYEPDPSRWIHGKIRRKK